MGPELAHNSTFGKTAAIHIRAVQEDPVHIAKIQGELLLKLTGANTIYNLDPRPKILNVSGEIVEGESNFTLFNCAVEELQNSCLQLPNKYWEKYFIDPNKMDPQNEKILQQGTENSTAENRILCSTYLMLDMLKSKFGATKLPENF
jgi:hypothetical protein